MLFDEVSILFNLKERVANFQIVDNHSEFEARKLVDNLKDMQVGILHDKHHDHKLDDILLSPYTMMIKQLLLKIKEYRNEIEKENM